MVAINFSVFIDKIKDGSKQQTIRKSDRNSQIKAGAKLQLYTGMRTADCRKIRDDVVCVGVTAIMIDVNSVTLDIPDHDVPSTIIDDYEGRKDFARADGFDDWPALSAFFHRRYGLPFVGVLIKWEDGAGYQCNQKKG